MARYMIMDGQGRTEFFFGAVLSVQYLLDCTTSTYRISNVKKKRKKERKKEKRETHLQLPRKIPFTYNIHIL